MSTSVKKDFVLPIVVLTLICLVITALLAVTNHFTEPVILTAAEARAEAARAEIIPAASGFEEEPLNDSYPASVKSIYRSTNDVGTIFIMSVTGYGGEMEIICGIDNDGKIIDVKTLSHSETKGMGSKTAEEPFRSQFVGKDSSLKGVNAVSGATISSKAYLGAIHDAFDAWQIVKGAA